jgi:hypothetical protein
MRWLEAYRPDVVVASPFIFPASKELEYIKAAKALSIPTVGAVLSWDNLTSKGTFHVIPDVKQLADALNERTGRGEIGLLVRPHPTNAAIWDGFEDDRMIIWPRGGEYVDVAPARQNYYESIYYSSAVMGVNTSAMVETTILDKPCLTVMNEHYKATQSGVGHFRHLTDAGFMEVAGSFKEASDILAKIVSGKDEKKAQRRRFVKAFIRPLGIETPASEMMATFIVAVASKMDLQTVTRGVTKP